MLKLFLGRFHLSKKIIALTDFVTAQDAAQILTLKHGRPILPDYIHKIRQVRFVKLNRTTKLYHKDDILACHIKQKSVIPRPTTGQADNA